MRLAVLTRVERNARRLTEILAVLGRYGLADWLGGLDYEWLQGRLVSKDGERLGRLKREARIRLALTDLGTTAIKFGQMLSTRADLVGPSLAEELSQLRSRTPPDPIEVVRAAGRIFVMSGRHEVERGDHLHDHGHAHDHEHHHHA